MLLYVNIRLYGGIHYLLLFEVFFTFLFLPRAAPTNEKITAAPYITAEKT